MLLLSSVAIAQKNTAGSYTFEFRGESMIEVLDRIARQTDIDLVYDPQLIQGINVYKRIEDKSQNELLFLLLNDYRLDYITLSSGTIVIIRSVHESASFGTYSGKIVDNETGEPLPGATVLLADASGGTSTNRSGTFSLNRVMSGTHQIIISYLGYESVYKTIDIRPDHNIRDRISLNPRTLDVSPLIVHAHRPRLPVYHSGTETDPNTEWVPGGTMRNPIRSLNLVSGVQYGIPMADLHLQGGQESEHRILLDGVPVYNPYSFGRMFSSFSPYAIGGVKLHKAGYGVEQGSQISGLIGFSHDLNSNDENGILFQADPLTLNLRGDLSIPVKKKDSAINLMAALRTNYWDIYRSPALDQTLSDWNVIDPLLTNMLADLEGADATDYSPVYNNSDIDFYDFHIAAGYEPDSFSSVEVSFYAAGNRAQTELLNRNIENDENAPFLFADDQHQWENIMGQLTWTRMLSARLDMRVQTAFSQNHFDHSNSIGVSNFNPYAAAQLSSPAFDYVNGEAVGRNYTLLPTQIDGNSIRHILVRSDFTYSFTPSFKLDFGLQYDHIVSDVELSDLSYLPADTREESGHLSTFLKANHTLGNRLRIDYGSRLTWINRTGKIYAEPRVSVQYDEPDAAIGYWSARVAGGVYRQFINKNEVTNVGATSIVPAFSVWSHAGDSEIPKAFHLTGSFLNEISGSSSLSLDVYHKWQPVTNITSYSNLVTGNELDRTEVRAFAETTSMRAFGGGIRFNQTFPESGLRVMAGYDYSHAEIDLDSQFGKQIMAPWNEPHRTQLRAIWRVVPDFSIVGAWQGVWGRSWAYRQSYYNFLQFRDEGMAGDVSLNSPENDQLKPFHQVDLSFIYQPELSKADLDIRLELINVLNRENTLEKSLYPVTDGENNTSYEQRSKRMPGFYPTASIRIKF